MKTSKEKNKSIDLIYFKSYSNFSYNINGKYDVIVRENTNGHTVFSISEYNICRDVIIILQTPLNVFYNISPDKLIKKYLMMEFKCYKSVNEIMLT